ncbi:PTS system mannose/fructose/sorbose family transporter subunit IID [Desulfovibrionales bacterium]
MKQRILVQTFLRTFAVGAAFNTKGMQNVGLSFIMEPVLTSLYGGDPSALHKARNRYLRHYNTHPFWTPLLVGIFVSMEIKIAKGLMQPDILPKVRTTTIYALSALGDSFFGGSFLVFWSLVCVNLAVREQAGLLAVWIGGCWFGLLCFKAITFARGYALGLAFLQRLKSWNLIDWGQRLKIGNGVLTGLFAVQVLPDNPLWAGPCAVGVAVLAWASLVRMADRCLFLALVLLGVLFAPWQWMLALVCR